MGTKSSTGGSAISLPKGGGALHGIGEKFSPDLYTGTGNFTVPIALPSGRNGFQPQLNLVYSTGNGNGPFGLGWSLSVPGVTLKTSKGIPRYQGDDVYMLSGAEDLVLVSEDSTSSQYRPRTEGLFARIYHHHDVTTSNDYWEVWSKDGLVSYYGAKRPEAAPANWCDPAVIANPDPDKRHHIFAWRLTQTTDPFGNHIIYEYERDLREDGPHHWDQVYLKRIRYADYTAQGETKYLVSVTFSYTERPDPFSDYRAGFEVRTTKRCTRIEIRTHADQERLVRAYDLVYLDERRDSEQLPPANGISLLNQIIVTSEQGNHGWAWGAVAYTHQLTPERVPEPIEVGAIAAGNAHSLALALDRSVWAWGSNNTGQLGDGTRTDRQTPALVRGLSGVMAVSAGWDHSLALKADGTVWAWGDNTYGQLGVDSTVTQLLPVQVGDLNGVKAIAAGKLYSLALKADGTVWAWGYNGGGALGDGTGATRWTPVQVQGLNGIEAIAAGGSNGLALKSDGTVWAWGYNAWGGCGDSLEDDARPAVRVAPVQVAHLTGVVAIAGGAGHNLALKADGTVWAWGLNSGAPLPALGGGQLGDGTVTNRSAPVQVVGLNGIVAVAAGGGQSLALTSEGAVWAWGVNVYGQVGDGTTTARLMPVPVEGLTNVVTLAAGYWHSVALTRPPSSLSTVETMPPLEFGYTQFEPTQRRFSPLQGRDLPAISLAHPDLALVDLFGNGLPDIVEMNGTVRYWRNLGNGQFDLPRDMRTAPAGVGLADPGVQLLDANGDGRMDLLVTTETRAGYYPLQFDGLWDRRSFQSYELAPSFNLKDPEVHLVDLDGDGVTDAMRSGSRFECFFNDPQEGWNGVRWVERRALDVFPNVNFSDPRVKWADMTADGLQDIVLVHDGNVEYWPNLGYGNWGKRIHMQNSPRFPYGYDPKRVLIGDVDGDGLADIVYVANTKVTLWINQSGNSWSDPIVIKGTPSVSDLEAVRLADVLGAGVSGVLWSADADESLRQHMFFLDFTGGIKPYVLNEMDNHIGAVTRVAYTPSTRFYLEDQKRPETRWRTSLPFPVQVVARVETIDAISGGKLTTEYRYHHGYWDGAEHEFRGFGRVDQRDTEVFGDFHATGAHPPDRPFHAVPDEFFSPPTETRTWFHQGPTGEEFGEWQETDFHHEFWSGDPQALSRPTAMTEFLRTLPRRARRDALRTLRGSVLRTELYALDSSARQSRPYTVTEQVYGVREEAPPVADDEEREHIFFPYALAQRTTQWERGADPMTQFTFTDDYDAYGQPRSQISIAAPRGRDFRIAAATPTEPYLATQTVTHYAQRDDDQHYMVDRVARTITYEISNDGSLAVSDLRDAIIAGSAARRSIGQSLNFYDGLAFQGLPFGQLGDYGALVFTESLVLTPEILHEAYKNGSAVLTPPEEPPYLATGSSPVWTAEYTQEFRTQLPVLAGYTYQSGGAESAYEPGYFAATERRRYDFHDDPAGKGRGLLKTIRDPLGHDTNTVYDVYDLLPTTVTNPAGLTVSARYDYRILQPQEATDPNGNRTAYAFTPLGLLMSTAVMGKSGENTGDTLMTPGLRMEYDFLAFTNRAQPISVRTIKRVHHVNDIDVSQPARDETIESYEYSDGFGRLLQTRTQAEEVIFDSVGVDADQSLPVGDAVGQQQSANDPPRVVVSGWQVYDNKGRIVEQYEPFFADGWDYAPPTDVQRGQKVSRYYDPRGQVIRTVNPDGSEQRVVHGVPGAIDTPDLTNPAVYEPTPWEAYTYDANDNAGLTHPTTSTSYQRHWNTPTSALLDALGRTITTVERNGPDPATDWYTTHSTYDIRGNLLTVTDALGRVAFTHVYNLVNRPLRVDSLDAGTRRSVLDAAGNVIEERDSKGALVLHAYDILNRPTRLWGRDGSGQPLTLRQRLIYGDSADAGLSAAQAEAANLLGKLYQHYDEAGRLTFAAYDFKGNGLEKARQVIRDDQILNVFAAATGNNWVVQPFRIDWQPSAGTTLEQLAQSLLEPTTQQTSLTYDALNRVKTMSYPAGVDGVRKVLKPIYNSAGVLESVKLDDTTYVERIAYNARGQRMLIAYGNGVMTRYVYDSHTFRLVRLRTERHGTPAGASLFYHPTVPNDPLQDLAYEYDLAGNILALHDRTPQSGLPAQPDLLDRAFTYDPIYRLRSATGRECDVPPPPPPWNDQPRDTDLAKIRSYTEQYQYDPVGNVQQLQHTANTGSFTRVFNLASQGNRLATLTVGTNTYSYTYDANGNLTQETTSRRFEWDHSDRIRVYRTQVDGVEPSVHAHYLYDAGGQRVKKLVRKQGGQYEVTVYVDGVFEYQRTVQGNTVCENNTLHVMDNQQRIALVRVGAPFPGDTTPAVKYHLGDHLGSNSIVIDNSGAWINREEYTPYGETSFGSFAFKRYRFTGKERDEENSLYYHGARYYAPWLARWVSCDPAGIPNKTNLYVAFLDNPMKYIDPTGLDDVNGTPSTAQSEPAPLRGSPAGGIPENYTPYNPYNPCDAHTSTSDPSRPVLGLDALAQVPNFPWKKALNLLPEALGKTKEERKAENTAIFERAGAPPETASRLAELYAENADNVGASVGGLLGGALGGRIIGPSPKGPYFRLKNPFFSAPRPTIPASSPRPFVNSGGTVVVEDELMARGTFETVSSRTPARPPVTGPVLAHRPMAPGETPIQYGDANHQTGLENYFRLTDPHADNLFLNVARGQTGPDVWPLTNQNFVVGELKPITYSQSKLVSQIENWGVDPMQCRLYFYDRQGFFYEGVFNNSPR